jgi:TPR repeat protein
LGTQEGKILMPTPLTANLRKEEWCSMNRIGVIKQVACVFALAVALASPRSAHSAPPGEGAYRSGDYPRAVRKIVPAAERGNARAQAHLGFMYQYGRGVPQNFGLAVYWYTRGAEQGNPVAQHLLGLMYDKGLGVVSDHVLAHMWLNLAAARTKGAEHESNVRLRDAVASKMSHGQLADAQYLARAWVPKPER